jgi:predicted negative regulator of RcsB-dependent stress response
MAYDLEEQEQLDEFKAWWKANGKVAISLVLAALLAYAAWLFYQSSINKKSIEASALYQALVTTELTKTAEIKAQASTLMANFSSTPYAGRAAVFAAKAHASSDITTAKTELEWAQKNAKETSVQAIASLQLSAILLAEKKYDDAIKQLNLISDKGFEGLKQSMLGDTLLAQGKTADARKAFNAALENLDEKGKLHIYTRQKLDALGQ